MRNYNIYVNGHYMYTSLCEVRTDAEQIAKREAMWQNRLFPNLDWQSRAIPAYYGFLTSELGSKPSNQLFLEENKHITYNTVLTESDTIPEDELIFDYIKDDYSGRTVGTGNGCF